MTISPKVGGFKGGGEVKPIFELLITYRTTLGYTDGGSVTNNTFGYTGGGSVTIRRITSTNSYHLLTSLTLDMRVVVLSPVVLVRPSQVWDLILN